MHMLFTPFSAPTPDVFFVVHESGPGVFFPTCLWLSPKAPAVLWALPKDADAASAGLSVLFGYP
ncbi:MAG: hypothetical protein A3H70_01040 [Candidatus Komeilibacteria bacterium RIFCSPLOWO2_02_FULL_48_11]|uniref:Uncharacterized protein n=1 Tax=Candidatus Komeilibacteria bacterium RIFCSPLOWO2_02_FULL_48_11 TaxID=1798553 RepID=A0A1G2BSZ0_9BACT|nr:MAG: hypothetical protein A3H70_01040 [Candidatus Komeilibacteria bacterium RIFCSPLOWO2_02_FULL_48_11]